MNLTREELDLRLQNIQCCIGTMANNLLAKIKIGASDVDCKLEELQVIQRMYKYIKCFHPEDSEVLATGLIEITTINIGDVGNILINGSSIIGGPQTVLTTDVQDNMETLVELINNSQDVYVGTYNPVKGENGVMEITGTCNNDILTFTLVGSAQSNVNVEGLTGGECEYNCLTEDQVKSMLDYIATKCKHCHSLSI